MKGARERPRRIDSVRRMPSKHCARTRASNPVPPVAPDSTEVPDQADRDVWEKALLGSIRGGGPAAALLERGRPVTAPALALREVFALCASPARVREEVFSLNCASGALD